jgi:hypothetical protein
VCGFEKSGYLSKKISSMDSTESIYDLAALNHLQKKIGNFLIADYSLTAQGYNYSFDITLTDPSNGQIVFEAGHTTLNWDGLDQPLFYPVLNSMKDWIDENKNK